MAKKSISLAEATCKLETIKHIETVGRFIKIFTDRLTNRGVEHDKLKLDSPEVELSQSLLLNFHPLLMEAQNTMNFLRG